MTAYGAVLAHACCTRIGTAHPRYTSIRCEKDIGNWSFATSGPAVMKLDGTSGGNGVKVVDRRSKLWLHFES